MESFFKSLVPALFILAAVSAGAAEPRAEAAGVWKWTMPNQNGDPIQLVLKLKLEGDQLSGSLSGRDGTNAPIQEGKIQGDTISFKVVRERNGNKIAVHYSGQLAGDVIRGKSNTDFNGETRTRDWEAHREGGAPTATGTWKYSLITPSGQSVEATLELKQDREKLIGNLVINGNELPIRDGQVKDDQVSFVLARKRDKVDIVTRYNGQLTADRIKGKTISTINGEEKVSDWDARRLSYRSAAAGDLTGTWLYNFTTPGGQVLEPKLKFTQDGEQLNGSIFFNENEVPISEGRVKDGEISFKVIRDRDGQILSSTYQGKAEGSLIRGKIQSNWSGTERTNDFEARRSRQ